MTTEMSTSLSLLICFVILQMSTTAGSTSTPTIASAEKMDDGTYRVSYEYTGSDVLFACLGSGNLSLIFDGEFRSSHMNQVHAFVTVDMSDHGKNVSCVSTNETTGEVLGETSAMLYLRVKPTSTTMELASHYEENDVVILNCTSTGMRPAGNVTFKLSWDDEIENLQKKVLYNRVNDTYTVVVSGSITASRKHNDRVLGCLVELFGKRVDVAVSRLNVYYGLDNNSIIEFTGPETGNEFDIHVAVWSCRVAYTNPAVTMKWFNGSEEFNSTFENKKKEEVGNMSYTGYSIEEEWFFSFQRNFNGSVIWCVGRDYKNNTVTAAKEIKNVYYKPELKITGDLVVDEGGTLNLTCEVVDANPMVNLSWAVPTEVYSFVNRKHIQTGKYKHTLTISPVRRYIDDFFMCYAGNVAGTGETSVAPKVQYGPDIHAIRNRVVTEGKNVTFLCNVAANPKASIRWQKQGNNSCLSTGKSLFLMNVATQDSGIYECHASSLRKRGNDTFEEFTANMTVELKVQSRPSSSSDKSSNVGAIAGGVIGAIAGIVIIAVIVLYIIGDRAENSRSSFEMVNNKRMDSVY